MPGKEARSWIKFLLTAIVLAIIIRHFLLAFYVVDGNSMQPTLQNGQVIAVNKLVYRINPPRHGDIVVFAGEQGFSRGRPLIKRVIALPGDTLAIYDGVVFLNDRPLQEDYTGVLTSGFLEPIVIGENMLFVMGDNREPRGSWDSREFGPISIDSVLGRAALIVFPVPGKVD